ncbi:hypothetical protein KC945_02995 [Candidatus Saccharibacteria bacterium]|nr:hypothetical protein [Candidatus Saccharibacteria bacterium]
MNQLRSSGFTIIEVTLFLAISGLLLIGVMAAINTNINQQRYMDAVRSFQDYLQGQYNLVDNVRNNRPDYACDAVKGMQAGTDVRGTTNCTIIGRFVSLEDNGKTLKSRPIYATKDIVTTSGNNDEDLLSKLGLTLGSPSLSQDDDESTVSWGANAYIAGNPNNKNLHMVIVRIPNSTVRTYASTDSTANTISKVIGSSSDINLCVNPDGMVTTPKQMITIRKDGSNANAIQFVGDSSAC